MLKAMIVDDEAPARSELKFLLDELGQTEVVAEAASVREAIEKLKEYPVDVMFLDVNMPEATGLQLAEALQHLKFPPCGRVRDRVQRIRPGRVQGQRDRLPGEAG